MDTTKNESTTLPQTATEPIKSGGHVFTVVLVALLLVTIVILGVFLNRRFRLVSWVRYKLHQRNSSYDEVMIGHDLDDDDPPLR